MDTQKNVEPPVTKSIIINDLALTEKDNVGLVTRYKFSLLNQKNVTIYYDSFNCLKKKIHLEYNFVMIGVACTMECFR